MKPALLLLAGLAGIGGAQAQEPAPSDGPALQDFNRRIGAYINLHKKALADTHRLKPTKSQDKIEEHEHEFARNLRAARHGVAQGNIFTPAIAAEFRRCLGATMSGNQAPQVRESLKRAEPVRLKLRVNSSYPQNVPLQSSPPSLLSGLPKLPPELEYRVAGGDLVLRDIEANLIVDVLPNAIH